MPTKKAVSKPAKSKKVEKPKLTAKKPAAKAAVVKAPAKAAPAKAPAAAKPAPTPAKPAAAAKPAPVASSSTSATPVAQAIRKAAPSERIVVTATGVAPNQAWKGGRYVAFVLGGRGASPTLVELGSAEELDALIGEWRSALLGVEEATESRGAAGAPGTPDDTRFGLASELFHPRSRRGGHDVGPGILPGCE